MSILAGHDIPSPLSYSLPTPLCKTVSATYLSSDHILTHRHSFIVTSYLIASAALWHLVFVLLTNSAPFFFLMMSSNDSAAFNKKRKKKKKTFDARWPTVPLLVRWGNKKKKETQQFSATVPHHSENNRCY